MGRKGVEDWTSFSEWVVCWGRVDRGGLTEGAKGGASRKDPLEKREREGGEKWGEEERGKGRAEKRGAKERVRESGD